MVLFASYEPLLMVTALVMRPAAELVRTMVTVAVVFDARFPRAQVTVPLVLVRVPTVEPELPAMNPAPDGSGCVRTALMAVPGPLFVMTTVLVRL